MKSQLGVGAALAAVLLFTAPGFGEEIYPGYTWQSLGRGIYVHSRNEPLAGPIDGNSTVIVNEEGVVVVDTHIDPAAARAVIAKIRQLTDRPVTHLVNTHWHDDHTNGNHAFRQAFPEAEILAHRATLESLKREWQAMEEQRRAAYESVQGRDVLAAAEAVEAEDPDRARDLRLFNGYRQALEPELEALELVYPDTLIDDRWNPELESRAIEVLWLGRGNTDGDLLVWLPEEKILVTGDLVVAPIPYAFDAPMIDWIETLARVSKMEVEMLVPGHGAVQRDTRYLQQVRSLLEATVEAVQQANTAGVAYGDLASAVDLTEQEQQFTGGDPVRAHAWRSFYLTPGLSSAWTSLGLPVPEEAGR